METTIPIRVTWSFAIISINDPRILHFVYFVFDYSMLNIVKNPRYVVFREDQKNRFQNVKMLLQLCNTY